MEELYTIAVSFGKIVHNRGFSQGLGSKACFENEQEEVIEGVE